MKPPVCENCKRYLLDFVINHDGRLLCLMCCDLHEEQNLEQQTATNFTTWPSKSDREAPPRQP